jgi:hypothetical protein
VFCADDVLLLRCRTRVCVFAYAQQHSMQDTNNAQPRYRGVLHCMATIVREGGALIWLRCVVPPFVVLCAGFALVVLHVVRGLMLNVLLFLRAVCSSSLLFFLSFAQVVFAHCIEASPSLCCVGFPSTL